MKIDKSSFLFTSPKRLLMGGELVGSASEGGWRKTRPLDRQVLQLRLADLVETHTEELAALDTLAEHNDVDKVSSTTR